MTDRSSFIPQVLRGAADFLSKNYSPNSEYTYEKGYLADADIIIQDYVKHAINKLYPDDLIYSEEDDSTTIINIPNNSCLWVLDPICGTANYIKGFPFYAHAISVYNVDGVQYAGIYHSDMDELFFADKKCTTLNGTPVFVSDIPDLQDALVSVNCNQAAWKRKESSISKLVEQFAPPVTRRIHILESANLEMAYVACGRLDAYINPEDKIWDIAAGSLLISSAGGEIYIANGSLAPPFSRHMSVIATNKYLMDKIKSHY